MLVTSDAKRLLGKTHEIVLDGIGILWTLVETTVVALESDWWQITCTRTADLMIDRVKHLSIKRTSLKREKGGFDQVWQNVRTWRLIFIELIFFNSDCPDVQWQSISCGLVSTPQTQFRYSSKFPSSCSHFDIKLQRNEKWTKENIQELYWIELPNHPIEAKGHEIMWSMYFSLKIFQ